MLSFKGGKRRKERWKKAATEKHQRGRDRETKRAKSQDDSSIRYMGHEFTTLNSVITIPTACEVCSSFTWLKEKGLVCQSCKLTCHKKCYNRITTNCLASSCTPSGKSSGSGATSTSHTISIAGPLGQTNESSGSLFGVTLDKLVGCGSTGSSQRLPPIIERLINTIELVGLYTEGLYRKSGVSSRVQQLKKMLEEESASSKEGAANIVDLQEQPVHVLTAVLKAFLRELPQPLLTYERYDDFLRAADIVDNKERVSSLMALVQELPPHHFDLLERLVFHLTRVALNEKSNRMGPNALSIVFAPCILRTAKLQQAQDSLSNVSKQTSVVETILTEQLRRVTETLADIDSLDSVCLAYVARLGTLRSSKMLPSSSAATSWPPSAQGDSSSSGALGTNQHQRIGPTVSAPASSNSSSLSSLSRDQVTEERLIQEHLEELREEKAALAATLPSLARAASDDDFLSTDGDLDGYEQDSPIGGSVDDLVASSQSRSDSRPRGKLFESRYLALFQDWLLF